jgi:hypothetical protein
VDWFRKSLTIRERLVAQDPDNAGWQRDVSVCFLKLGWLFNQAGIRGDADIYSKKALGIFELLADLKNSSSILEVSLAVAVRSRILRMEGFETDAATMVRRLLTLDFEKADVAGSFRKTFVPILLEELDGLYPDSSPTERVGLARNALSVCAGQPVEVLSRWVGRGRLLLSDPAMDSEHRQRLSHLIEGADARMTA